jgi:hypothetical protein
LAQDKPYINQRRRTQRALKGRMVGGQLIVKVGSPIDARNNKPSLVPFQLKNGRFGVFWGESNMDAVIPDNPDAAKAIEYSTRMPKVGPGFGSDVVHIRAYPKKKGVKYAFIKVYFNDKAGRGDSYQEMTYKEAAAAAKAMKKEAKTQPA